MYDFEAAYKKYTCFPVNCDIRAALDAESTGLSPKHGDRPFMLAATLPDGTSYLWQAEVDPFTRMPKWSAEDKAEIKAFVMRPDVTFIMTNMKFDTRMIRCILEDTFDPEEFLSRCHETIGMHHALQNRESHALKDAAAKHGGIPDTDQKELHHQTKLAVEEARALGWKVASAANCPHVSTAPDGGWHVMDMWVPRQLALHYWRTSEAYQYLESLPKVQRFADGTTHDERMIACFGNRPDLLKQITPTVYEITKEQRAKLFKFQGWEWHPPEVYKEKVHLWHNVCAIYCQLDTLRSVTLYDVFRAELIKQKLWDQYMEGRINALMTFIIEETGISYIRHRSTETRKAFKADADYAKAVSGFVLSPIFPFNPSSPDKVREVLYGPKYFNLPITRRTDAGNAVTDKDFLASVIGDLANLSPVFSPQNLDSLSPPTYLAEDSANWRKRMKQWHKDLLADEEYGLAKQLYMFCASILQFNANTKGIQQMDNFDLLCLDRTDDGYATLYGNINPYGTDTTRQSSSGPNLQNISKGGKNKGSIAHLFKQKKTLRGLFGPRPGWEWWSNDYHQIQLFILFFMAKDDKMIKLALAGEDFHSAVARILFGHSTDPSDPPYNDFDPKNNPEHANQRDVAKTLNFAFAFGAGESKINRVCGIPGMYEILSNRMPSLVEFIERKSWEVDKYGYVYTAGGYRLYVDAKRAYAGSVYAVQGTEGEIVKRATYGVQHYIDQRGIRPSFHCTVPVHDDLTFNSRKDFGIRHIGPVRQIMEDAALSFGFPCPVSTKYCPDNWGEGEEIEFELEE